MIKETHPKWRSIMPSYHKFQWEDFSVRAKPVGWRRAIPFFPYIIGTKPTFRVTINTKSGEQRQLKAYLDFVSPNQIGIAASKNVISTQKKPMTNINEKIVFTLIASGDHVFHIYLVWGEKEHRGNLLTFKAIAQETMLAWVIGTLIAIALLVVGIWNIVLLTLATA